MNTRYLIASSLTALMMITGNAVAEEQAPAPFPSSAREVGGHWTHLLGPNSVPGNGRGVFPTGGRRTTSQDIDARAAATPARNTPNSISGFSGSTFPTSAIEVSGQAIY